MFHLTRRITPLVASTKKVLIGKQLRVNSQLYLSNLRTFSTKNDKDKDNLAKKEEKEEKDESEAPSVRGGLLGTKKRFASRFFNTNSEAQGEDAAEIGNQTLESSEGVEMFENKPVQEMYTIKFNSPILPYSKFPLTQNKYIQQFFKRYSRDKSSVEKLIGVHFLANKNSNAKEAIGIEIELDRGSSNMNVVESKSFKRFKVISYDDQTNFVKAVEYGDRLYRVRNSEGEKVDMTLEEIFESENCPDKPHFEDLINSEISDLKNTWFQFNKRMNSALMMLPSEMINTYDMVVKTLPVPNFEIHRYRSEISLYELFNQITCKMAHYYFSMFQALFSKDQKDMKKQMKDFLVEIDPVMRSKKVTYLFDEFTHLLDQKCYYIQKTAEEFKERSKQAMLESAFQKVLENNKTNEKDSFQKMLDEVEEMPDRIRKIIQEEINGLESKSSDMDSARKATFLQHVFRLPWDKRIDAYWDVQFSRQVLEESHYGMVETKERILEFIAKNKRINSKKGMVLLLTGPPGVGKTSIANSIGDCLKRPTAVISMSGQSDPSHIKGSKRTYVDSQPGIFIKELQRLEVRNPVLIIDEIDKIGFNSIRGDPSSTLLELLNPEQANTFSDNYLDFEFDFSECIFICTSNSTQNMLQPLLDRIEVIEVPPYLPTEKLSIAKKYLIPNFRKEYGFVEEKEEISFTNAAIAKVIKDYCGFEAGVRNLRKCIDRVFRKVVAKIDERDSKLETEKKLLEATETEATVEDGLEEDGAADIDPTAIIDKELTTAQYQIHSENLEKFLDVSRNDDYYYRDINKTLPVGCANGLAYIDSGYGSVLKIQFVKKFPLKKKKKDEEDEIEFVVSQTGRLGEVMKESLDVVQVATLNYLGDEVEGKNEFHLHVPQGAIPKDGPSAGVALFCSLASIIRNKSLNPNLAMTGEITTLGEVVAIGGVREKLTACKNHNITQVMLPYSNKKDFEKLPDDFKEGFEIFFVKNIEEAYRVAFTNDREGIESKYYEKDEKVEQIFAEEIMLDDNQLDHLI
ncbi:unnamed protein product [Moneuplotes crassus]|uniref:Lon proteolytic domain-containing protein n=1 Tax=Euplotes crassus TaxID=5936 RepID=A0AAD2D2F4_EUPCR|nr:unnamed protein product [Moneuplotes crassus]